MNGNCAGCSPVFGAAEYWYITILVHLHDHYYSKHRAVQTCLLQVLVPVGATVCMYVSGRQVPV